MYANRLAERIWVASLDGGCDRECGSVCECGEWYGLVEFRRASVILSQTDSGRIDAAVYPHDEAAAVFDQIESDLMVSECED